MALQNTYSCDLNQGESQVLPALLLPHPTPIKSTVQLHKPTGLAFWTNSSKHYIQQCLLHDIHLENFRA